MDGVCFSLLTTHRSARLPCSKTRLNHELHYLHVDQNLLLHYDDMYGLTFSEKLLWMVLHLTTVIDQ